MLLSNCIHFYGKMLKFYANSNIMVVGATSSGKTTTVLEIIKQKLIEPWPQKIFYLYGAKQKFMDSWNNNKHNSAIEFISGLELGVLETFSGPKLLIIDDLCLSQNKDLTNHFIRGSHHLQTTTIYISHSIFLNDDNYRVMSNNCQYMLIMRNKRNLAQLTRLARQILGSAYIRILEAYDYNKNNQFGFVLLSFHPKVPEELLVLSDFFKSCPSIFL